MQFHANENGFTLHKEGKVLNEDESSNEHEVDEHERLLNTRLQGAEEYP